MGNEPVLPPLNRAATLPPVHLWETQAQRFWSEHTLVRGEITSLITTRAKSMGQSHGGLTHLLGLLNGLPVGLTFISSPRWSLESLHPPLLAEQEGTLLPLYHLGFVLMAAVTPNSPIFTHTPCPAGTRPSVTAQNEDASEPCCVKARAGAFCSPFLCVCVLLRTPINSYKHRFLAKSYSDPLDRNHLSCLRFFKGLLEWFRLKANRSYKTFRETCVLSNT